MADIFISYWSEEYAVASNVRDLVLGFIENANIFMADSRTIRAGQSWLDIIKKELSESKVVLALLSDESVKRPWINFEAGAAWIDRVLIPLCFGGMDKGHMPAPYNQLQALQLREPADQYRLIQDLYFHLNLGAPPGPHYIGLPSMRFENEHPLRQLHRDFTSLIEHYENE